MVLIAFCWNCVVNFWGLFPFCRENLPGEKNKTKSPVPSLPVSDQYGGGSSRFHLAPLTSERFRSRPIFCTGCWSTARPSRVHSVRLRHRFHHGGHFDVDVFRHRRPRLPFLHHLLAVMMMMIRLGHTGGRCAGQQHRMCVLPALHPWFLIMDNGMGAFLHIL